MFKCYAQAKRIRQYLFTGEWKDVWYTGDFGSAIVCQRVSDVWKLFWEFLEPFVIQNPELSPSYNFLEITGYAQIWEAKGEEESNPKSYSIYSQGIPFLHHNGERKLCCTNFFSPSLGNAYRRLQIARPWGSNNTYCRINIFHGDACNIYINWPINIFLLDLAIFIVPPVCWAMSEVIHTAVQYIATMCLSMYITTITRPLPISTPP